MAANIRVGYPSQKVADAAKRLYSKDGPQPGELWEREGRRYRVSIRYLEPKTQRVMVLYRNCKTALPYGRPVEDFDGGEWKKIG